MHQIGEDINLHILRNGKIENITYPLIQTRKDISLVTPKVYDKLPRYFIFGGIVFTPLTENLLCEWEDCDSPLDLLKEEDKRPSKNSQEIVVAVQILRAEINKGYHVDQPLIIREVNGGKFKNFNEFYKLVKNTTEPFIVFTHEIGYKIIIDRKKAYETHQDVLKTYNITADRSLGLR